MDIALVYAFLSFLAVVVLCRLLAVQQVEQTIEKTRRSQVRAKLEGRAESEAQRRRDEEAARREAESEALRRQLAALRPEHPEGGSEK